MDEVPVTQPVLAVSAAEQILLLGVGIFCRRGSDGRGGCAGRGKQGLGRSQGRLPVVARRRRGALNLPTRVAGVISGAVAHSAVTDSISRTIVGAAVGNAAIQSSEVRKAFAAAGLVVALSLVGTLAGVSGTWLDGTVVGRPRGKTRALARLRVAVAVAGACAVAGAHDELARLEGT